ncbi:MAG: hypothetical protein IJX78_04245 [Bacilli bacterium]|nr:hypothetical protein [Bacilli bacterium]
MLNIFQPILDFITEKCNEFVDYVLGLFSSFSDIMQALILLAGGVLVLIGIVAVIKKSAKLIITIASILVIISIVWMFI